MRNLRSDACPKYDSPCMLRILICLVLSGIFAPIAWSQNSVEHPLLVDSLKAAIRTDPPDTTKVLHLNILAMQLVHSKPDTSILLLNDALKVSTMLVNNPEAKKNTIYKNRIQKFISMSHGNLGVCYWFKA